MIRVQAGDPAAMTQGLLERFAAEFGERPQAIGRAPGRVNLIGEHTDYNAGLCLPIALPHAGYAAVRLRTDGELRIVSAQADDPWTGTVAGLSAGAVSGWAAYVAGVVWAMLEDGIEVPGADIMVDSTVPLGAGLSSSAALECSVGVGLATLSGLQLDEAGRRRLARLCVRAETDMAGAPTGGMDQTVSLLARPGHAVLLDFDADTAEPVPVDLAAAGLELVVVDTRVSHALTDGGYGARRADCEQAVRILGVPSLRRARPEQVTDLADPRLRARARHVVTEIDRVTAAVASLRAGDWATVGRLFTESHASLRDEYQVSCPELDTVVEAAVEAGALGARMTGGGFGGSAIALTPLDRVDDVVDSVRDRFASRGFAPPASLLAEAGPGAELTWTQD